MSKNNIDALFALREKRSKLHKPFNFGKHDDTKPTYAESTLPYLLINSPEVTELDHIEPVWPMGYKNLPIKDTVGACPKYFVYANY